MIGLMSDSHDNLEAIEQAVEFFNKKGVLTVLHAGDIVSPFTERVFKELNAKLYFVFGNNDGDRLLLKKWFEDFGAQCCSDFGDLHLDGRRIALLHGIYEEQIKAMAASGMFDVVVRGHTHTAGVVTDYGTPIINPGETTGLLTGRRTVALLDPESLEVEIVELYQ
ncbi:metallophosphoesterase [Methanomethylovorans sp.]|uniref:metallophosphoesterase n=1 Tax=Methanomethylovorans sp. TaxID=2758717 RepID=UPI00345ED025